MAQRAQGTRRVWVPAAFLGAFTLVVFGRLVQLQIIDHPKYARAAEQEQTGHETIYARRGSILDRNGNVLAASVDTWDISVNSRVWANETVAATASAKLAKDLNVDAASLRLKVAQGVANGQVQILIKRDVEYETGKRITSEAIDGVVVDPDTQRVNPEGDVGASIIGLIGGENVGLAGIESSYNDMLQGKAGKTIYERDTVGDAIPFGKYIAQSPDPGSDLVLTVDRYVQQLVERALDKAIVDHQATGGSITVMDPSTGEILALASRPGFKYSTLDLNDPKTTSLLNNAAVQNTYEPGSVMKIVTAAAAIDQGVVTADTTYVDTGVVDIYGIPIKNFQDEVWGTQTMTGVLQHSINTGAVFMVEKLGAATFQRYLDAFGFGKFSGIDFNGDSEGIVRRPSDAGWSPVDLATQAFGQSISVTPIQMISAVAAAINGGNLMKPHFVKATIDANGVRHEVQPVIEDRAISAATSATMRSMLGQVVDQDPVGTGRNPRNYTAGGKSGTANIPVPNGYNDRQIISFVGFAPLNSPKILILVKVDDNKDGATGTGAGGPIFANLADEILRYLNVPPDKGPNKP